IYRAYGSRSCVVTPLMEGDELIGALSFGCVTTERIWPPEFLPRLRLVAGILAGALVRRRIEHETRRKRDELAHPWRVASLGALATTLAHELTQPLTAAVANAQAARRLLSSGHTPRDADVVEAINDLEQDAT